MVKEYQNPHQATLWPNGCGMRLQQKPQRVDVNYSGIYFGYNLLPEQNVETQSWQRAKTPELFVYEVTGDFRVIEREANKKEAFALLKSAIKEMPDSKFTKILKEHIKTHF